MLEDVYRFLGGAQGEARRSTMPRRNFLMRWFFSFVDLVDVIDIGKAWWDQENAHTCFEGFCKKNGFDAKDANFEIRSIPDPRLCTSGSLKL